MKTNKLIYSLALVLAVALAGAGCKHKPVGVTKIPGSPTPVVQQPPENPTLTSTQPINPNNYPSGQPIPTAQISGQYSQNRDALAAYTIHFAFDSAVIRDSEQASLQSVAQQLSANPNDNLLIEGNCDERGTEEYNRSLGERRALAAREALQKLGLDPMRVRTESFGKDKPVDPGHDEAAWQKNRRDDFVLLVPPAGT